jgi:predicted dehydrogenase
VELEDRPHRRPRRQGRRLHRLEDVPRPAPKRPFSADRFFRFRKYWDYSGGVATDLFFHVVAPLNICWPEPAVPAARDGALGGIWQFKDEREVPDTFNLMADFPQGFSLVLSSSMANSQHIPGLIRGTKAPSSWWTTGSLKPAPSTSP